MKKTINKFFSNLNFAIATGIAGFLLLCLLASVFLITEMIDDDSSFPEFNTITITGEGEVEAKPDVATFSYTVTEVAGDVATAQSVAAEKTNALVEILTSQGVEEKDIKTLSYNIYPKYEWQDSICLPGGPCGRGERVLVGQEVTETVEVKVRDTQKAGEILSLIGEQGVDRVSGLSFTIDDEDKLQSKARELAIKDAKQKAQVLAEQLDIEIDEIISFYEEGERAGYGFGGMLEAATMDSAVKATPNIQTGENTITSVVNITFKIDD
jgi:uncharacterized protein YggE